jgi:predicted nucleic acid-binding protein
MASRLSSIGADDRVVVCAITRGEILFGIWIAAAAISLGATLVSSDRDFQSIAELAVVSL